MSGGGLHVTGLKQLVRDLEQLGINADDLKAAFRRIGTIVAAEGVSRINSKSGALAATVRPSNTKNKASVRAGSKAVPYAGVYHYGRYFTSTGTRIEGTLFLRNAARDKTPEMIRAIEAEMQVLIRKAGLT